MGSDVSKYETADKATGASGLAMAPLSGPSLQILQKIPVSALSTTLTKRGLPRACMQGVRPVNPNGARMVGRAYTLRYIPSRPDIDTLEAAGRDDGLQRLALEQCPHGFVLVIDARGDASAACAGDTFVSRLMYRACAGIVTDGGLRDASDIAQLGIPAFFQAPAATPTFVAHHPADLNVPIGCGGVAVYPGDVIVGDGDGVIVIPHAMLDDVISDALNIIEYDEYVQHRLAQEDSLIGLYPATPESRRAFQAWKGERP